ncbi:hypothetical protein ACOME3_004259 [Neoechinorhynchus agilis]
MLRNHISSHNSLEVLCEFKKFTAVNKEMGTPNRSRIRVEPSIECRDVGTSPWSLERKETPSHVSTSLPRPMNLRTTVEAVATRDSGTSPWISGERATRESAVQSVEITRDTGTNPWCSIREFQASTTGTDPQSMLFEATRDIHIYPGQSSLKSTQEPVIQRTPSIEIGNGPWPTDVRGSLLSNKKDRREAIGREPLPRPITKIVKEQVKENHSLFKSVPKQNEGETNLFPCRSSIPSVDEILARARQRNAATTRDRTSDVNSFSLTTSPPPLISRTFTPDKVQNGIYIEPDDRVPYGYHKDVRSRSPLRRNPINRYIEDRQKERNNNKRREQQVMETSSAEHFVVPEFMVMLGRFVAMITVVICLFYFLQRSPSNDRPPFP